MRPAPGRSARRRRSRLGCLGRLVAWTCVLGLLAVPAAIAVLAFAALDDAPAIAARADLASVEVERARALLREHDPRRLRDGAVKTLSLTQAELNLLANHAIARVGAGGALVVVAGGWLDLDATLALPSNPFGRYVNVSADLRGGTPLPRFRALRVGAVPIPAALADALLDRGVAWLYAQPGEATPHELVRSVRLGDGEIGVTYEWRTALVDAVRERLVPPEQEARYRAYHHELVRASAALTAGPSLADAIAPLFALARERSASDDPVAENRAAI